MADEWGERDVTPLAHEHKACENGALGWHEFDTLTRHVVYVVTGLQCTFSLRGPVLSHP